MEIVYLESIKRASRTAMTVGGKADEHVGADRVAVDDHLQPADRGHIAKVIMHFPHFGFFPLQTAHLTLAGIFGAKALVAAPWEDYFRMRCPCAHDGEDVCGVVAVELMVVCFADCAEGD